MACWSQKRKNKKISRKENKKALVLIGENSSSGKLRERCFHVCTRLS